MNRYQDAVKAMLAGREVDPKWAEAIRANIAHFRKMFPDDTSTEREHLEAMSHFRVQVDDPQVLLDRLNEIGRK